MGPGSRSSPLPRNFPRPAPAGAAIPLSRSVSLEAGLRTVPQRLPARWAWERTGGPGVGAAGLALRRGAALWGRASLSESEPRVVPALRGEGSRRVSAVTSPAQAGVQTRARDSRPLQPGLPFREEQREGTCCAQERREGSQALSRGQQRPLRATEGHAGVSPTPLALLWARPRRRTRKPDPGPGLLTDAAPCLPREASVAPVPGGAKQSVSMSANLVGRRNQESLVVMTRRLIWTV